jgi:hypothetical protein
MWKWLTVAVVVLVCVVLRMFVSDLVMDVIYTVIVGAGGSVLAAALLNLRERRLSASEGIFSVVICVVAILAGFQLNRDVADRATLIEQSRVSREMLTTVLNAYLDRLLGRVGWELGDGERRDFATIVELLSRGNKVGGVVDEPLYYEGMMSFYLGNRIDAEDRLRMFLDGRTQRGDDDRRHAALYARAVIAREMAYAVSGAARCVRLSESYAHVRRALEERGWKPAEDFRNGVATDLVRSECKLDDAQDQEVRGFASAPRGRTFVPEPEREMEVDRRKWAVVAWPGESLITYRLDLRVIESIPDLGGVLIEVVSRRQIEGVSRGMAPGVVVPVDQEPELRVAEERQYVFFFPAFDPKWRWYLDLTVRVERSSDTTAPFSTRVRYVRYP